VRAVIERYQGLAGLLDAAATPEERWALYSGLGLNLTYHRNAGSEHITGELGRGVLLGVGGGTRNVTPRFSLPHLLLR
jgi:hypothetical protein